LKCCGLVGPIIKVFINPFGLASRRRRSDDKSITLLPIRVQTCPTRKRCNLKHWHGDAKRAGVRSRQVVPSNSTISSRDYDNEIALQLLAVFRPYVQGCRISLVSTRCSYPLCIPFVSIVCSSIFMFQFIQALAL